MNDLLQKIHSRGYWRVVIRPGEFVEKRVQNIAQLPPILKQAAVRFRGWDFPHVKGESVVIGLDHISQEFEWDDYLEILRFYQSGQFVHISGMVEDWIDRGRLGIEPLPDKWLGVFGTVFRFTEIFELASRLALSEVGHHHMHIEIKLADLVGRILSLPVGFVAFGSYSASIQEFPQRFDIPQAELIGRNRELAIEAAAELFRRFGWDPDTSFLRERQDELLAFRSRGYRSRG